MINPKRLSSVIKKVEYNWDVMRQSACLILNLITVSSCGFRFSCMMLGQASSGSVVVDSLLTVASIVGFSNCSMFWCALLCVHSRFAQSSQCRRESLLLCLVWLPGVA